MLYYNPNIYPESEYTKRIIEQQKLIKDMRFQYPVSFLAGKYDKEKFYEMAKDGAFERRRRTMHEML